ncbi:MAG TPA: hypothetical protein VNO51_02005 [Ilumatobacteraceae bacterium]|nr:hypothetical protein [Ilumatobacteraceae bacterium]
MAEINYRVLEDAMERLTDDEAMELVDWLAAVWESPMISLLARQKMVLSALNVALSTFIAHRAVQWYDALRDLAGESDVPPDHGLD